MRKVMKQRIALLMSLAMVFTSVDSSVLVAASDVQESAVEETVVETAVEPVVEEYVETQGVASEEQDTEDLFDESDEDIIISETNDIEEEQIIDDSADDVADDVIETEAAAEISEIGAGEENQVPNVTGELTENVKIQIKDGLYYSFTPQETAKYYMQLAGYVNQIFYINDEDEIEYVSTGNQYELTKGTTYYICFGVDDTNDESDCTIKRVQEIESITATLSQTKYLKISGYWQSLNGKVKVTYKNGESDEQTVINDFYDSYGNWIDIIIKDSQGTECENVYNINELDLGTYSVAWECGDIESQPCSFTVTNEIDTAGELTENVKIQIKDGLYYSFTPQETAKYYMQLAGYVNQIFYINDEDEIEYVSTGNQYELTEGTTYYICFGGNDTNDESDCTIKKVQEIESITATLSQTKYVKTSDNWQSINGNVKVTYKNGESDEQTVINGFCDSYGNRIDMIIKDSKGTEYENVYSININELDLGTYSVAWECGDIESQPCSFTVTNEIDTAGELTENVKIQIKDGLYYSFTPQETAKYYMQLDGYVNQICYINDADEIEYVSTGNQYELTEGTTYYICFGLYDTNDESDCTIKRVQEIESITATLSQTKYLKISDNWQGINGNVKVTYKNGESDEQTDINDFHDSYGNRIAMIIKDSQGTECENVYNINELDLGTYSVAWECGDIESQPCSFTVTNEIDTAGELFEGNNTNITLNEEVTYYKFEPANTSRYWMRSENNSCDTLTIYHINAEGTIERIENEESFEHYKFTAGETYYIGIYSDGYETEYNYTIKAVPEITEVKLDVSKDTYVILPEAYQSLKGTVTVQFDNGTSKTDELNSFNVYSDYGYNYNIYTKDAEGNYEYFDIWNVNEYEIGSYNLVVKLEGVESNSCQIQLKDPVSVAKKMQLGENEVVSTSGSEIETYLFLPEKTGEYQFFPYETMKVFEVNEDNSYGDFKTYYSSEMISMEAGKRYLIYFKEGTYDEWGAYQSRWQMTISEKQSATGEVQVPTISFEEDFSTMEFVYEMDDMDCILDDYCNAVLVFADGTMEDVVIDHNVQLEIRDEQNNRVYTVRKPGRYHAIYTWAKTGQELANIPITICSPEELCEGIWDISKALTLDNQKETHVYKIAAGSNDRTVDISIDKQVKSMVCSADLQEYQMGYGAAVHENLLKDKEYYLVVRTDKKYSDITVTAEIQPEICSLTMSSAQKKYLGEVEYISEFDFKTVIEFSDGTTKSVYGQSSDICFRVNSGDGENSSFSNYYQPGTYQVIPELCTSTAISADYKVTGVSVNVEAINLDTLPELKEGTPLKGVKLVKFIPQDNQRYCISNDGQSYLRVYRLVNGKFEDYYYYDEEEDDDDDDSVILSGGETYVISAREQTTISAEKYQSGGATDKDGGALQLNVEKEVHIDVSGQNVWLSFTPEESGTYVFTSKANDDTYGYLYLGEEELNDDDDGGIGENFLILENLEVGKTYKYKVRYDSSSTGSFPVIVRKPVKVKDLIVSSSEWYFSDGELCGTVEIVLDNGEIITEAFKSLSGSGFYYENSIVQTVYQKGSKENEFIVKVRYKNGDEEWTLKTVTVTTLKEEKLVLTDTNSVEVPSYKDYMSGTIRVSKSGMYLMKAGNGMDVGENRLYSNGKKIDGNLFEVGFYLESGKEYKFALHYWLENSQNSQISLVEVKQVKQIKITQLPKSYMDRLEALDVSDLKIQVEFSDGTTQNISWNSDDSPLNDGRYIYVDETDVNDSKKKITVTLDGCSATGYVQLADPNQLPKVNFAEGKATISIPETKTKGNCVSAIVPSESGMYMVSWTNDAVSAPAKVYTDIELYDENLLNITQLHESDEIVLEAGKTYYVITLMCACTNDKVDPITNLKINFNLTEHEHNWVVDEKASTCTEDGYKKTICSICKELQPGNEVQIIPKSGHKEVIDSEVTPTCTKTGLTAGSHCEVCKKTIVAQEIVPAIGHTWSDWVPTKEATCTEKGIESHTCSICGETETRAIDKVPHTYSSEYTIDKQPTCTESGIKSRHCTINGCTAVTDEQELPALGHTWGKWEELKPATCAEEGTETRTCAVCGKTETRPIDKVPHTYSSEYTIDKQPTCTESGIKSRHCTINGCTAVTDEQELPALGHTWGKWEELKPATCAEEGTETRTCAVCGKTETRPIDKVPHTYSSEYTIDKQPTCTESGIKSRHCTINGCTAVTDEQELPALGHTWGKWEELKPATCAEEGTETRTCAVCGETETRTIDKVPHTYSSEYTIDKQPTCTESGIKSRHCTINGCTAVTDEQELPALGHTWGKWEELKPATCAEEGTETRTCAVCGKTETRPIDKVPHTYSSEYTIDKQPTCTESGIKSRHCTINGCTAVTDEQELPALGHTWGKWEELKPATCAEEGTETRTCAACGKTETRPIGKVPHKYSSEYTIDKQPTCTESGIKSRHCTTNGCTAVTDTQVIPALGHDMGSWTVTSPATVLAEGVETRTCSRGDAQETRAIPKLPAKLSVTANSLPMKTGQSTTLFKVTEMAAGDYLASVVSADTSIVKVSNVNPNGTFKLTAQKKTGNTKIKITLRSGTWKEVTISVQKAKVKTSAVVPSVRNVTIKQGQSTSVSAVAMPVTTADKIKYSTSNKKVATVSSRGVIKGVKAGTAKITIQAGSKKTTVTVKVEGVKTTNLTGVRESATLKKGKKLTISAKKVPSNSGDTITYASSNKKVAAVDKKGKVTAKGIGTAVITVKAGTVIKKMIINVTK